MDQITKKILEEKTRKIQDSWIETGLKSDQKFFGFFTKKGMSIAIYLTLSLVILANIGIWLYLFLANKP